METHSDARQNSGETPEIPQAAIEAAFNAYGIVAPAEYTDDEIREDIRDMLVAALPHLNERAPAGWEDELNAAWGIVNETRAELEHVTAELDDLHETCMELGGTLGWREGETVDGATRRVVAERDRYRAALEQIAREDFSGAIASEALGGGDTDGQ